MTVLGSMNRFLFELNKNMSDANVKKETYIHTTYVMNIFS